MDFASLHFAFAIVIGLGSTLFMDLWALFLKLTFNIPLPNYCLVGRWVCYMPDGIFKHASIAAAPQKRFECLAGWITHYAIGVIYAFIFIPLVSDYWLAQPTLLPAVLFGVISVSVPYFIMQPAFGLGIAASKTPNPTQARLRSLMAHTSFGVGLYLSALVASYVLPGL